MSFTTLHPEWCEINLADKNVYSSVAYTYSNFGSTPATERLYDYKSDLVLTSSSATGTTAAVIQVDLGGTKSANTVKILNCNWRDYLVQYSTNGSNWTTLFSDTNNVNSGIHNYVDNDGDTDDIWSELGEVLFDENSTAITEEANPGVVSFRYLKFTANRAFNYSDEKYVGEIYIGMRAMKLATGKVLDYAEEHSDARESVINTWDGYSIKNRSKQTYKGTFSISRPSTAEAQFIRDFIKKGYCYVFFPTGGEIGEELHFCLSFGDVYLVTGVGSWGINPFGVSGNGIITFEQLETKMLN
jgi:hypothetical protein